MLNPGRVHQASSSSKFIQVGIIALTLATAFIHIIVGFPRLSLFPVLFYLNALGYVVLLLLYYLPRFAPFHTFIRWLFIAYTLLTIILYFVLGHYPSMAAYIDKVVEAVLLILLLVGGRYRNHTRRSHA